jgi:hypothetical protein
MKIWSEEIIESLKSRKSKTKLNFEQKLLIKFLSKVENLTVSEINKETKVSKT